MKYLVVVPSDQSTKQNFSNREKAKKYLKTLKHGMGDDCGHMFDDCAGRDLFVDALTGKFNYFYAPNSWKNN